MKRLRNILLLLLALTGCNKVHKIGMYPTRESTDESTFFAQSTHLSYQSQVETAAQEHADIYPACFNEL